MRDDGSAHLNFVENLDYKFAELISLPFLISSEENVKLSISYRYNCLKAKYLLLHQKLEEVHSLLKVKNPTLLSQLARREEQKSLLKQSSTFQQNNKSTSRLASS